MDNSQIAHNAIGSTKSYNSAACLSSSVEIVNLKAEKVALIISDKLTDSFEGSGNG